MGAAPRYDAYIRVSRINGRDPDSDSFITVDQQTDKIAAWAKLRGVRIAKWHEPDLDQSGGKLSRPNFDKALERIRAGKSDGIVVSKLDRFSRAGVADALKLIESIIEAGGTVAAVEEGIDPTTPSGEFVMTLFLALARMQRQQIGAGWKDAQQRAVKRGVHVASKAPTGYRRTVVGTKKSGLPEYGPLELHPDHVHIAELFRRKADGASWGELIAYLHANEVESPYGNIAWSPRALAKIIGNSVYLGTARFGEFEQEDAHPAIIDRATWQAAQGKGGKPRNGLGGGLLSGLILCGGCHGPLKPDSMKDRPSGELIRIYRCRRRQNGGECPAPAAVLGRVVEPFIVEQVMTGFGDLGAHGSVLTAELTTAEQAVDQAERELSVYLAAVSAADVGAEAFAAGARQRREAADRAGDELEQLREQIGLADELPLTRELFEDWPNLPVAEQRQHLQAVLDAVVVSRAPHKGPYPIEQRTAIYWRGQAPADLPRPGRRRRRTP